MELLAVLGMHRSGTSLIAGMLRAIGWDVGPEDDLMPPKPDNPRGFVEHLPAVRINDRLLYRMGGTWDSPPALPPGWERREDLDDLRDEARAVVAGLTARDAERTLFKDPRLSLTLPFWQTVAKIPQVVLVLRPPRPVIRSLLRREADMSIGEAADLFSRYLLSALRLHTRIHIVDPGEVLAAPRDELVRLVEALGHDPDAAALDDALAAVDDDLWGRSSRQIEDPLDGPEVALAEHLHALVRDPEDGERWLPVVGRLELADTVGRLEERHRVTVDDLETKRDELHRTCERLRGERAVARERHNVMRDQRDACLAEIERLRAERDRIAQQRDEARRLLDGQPR